MSHYNVYADVPFKIQHLDCLVRALQESKHPRTGESFAKCVERHADALPLEGYMGDKRTERAHVVIPRRHLKYAANDIGFFCEADGTVRAIVSDNEQGYYGKGSAWLRRVTDLYHAAVAEKTIPRGFRVTRTEQPDGTIKLSAVKA
jgi:hypothetical protein